MVEAGPVQELNAFGSQQVAVGDQGRDAAATANALNELVQFGVKQGFAAADRDDRCPQFSKVVDAAQHDQGRDRLREIVELVAVRARQVTAPDRYDVGHDRMTSRLHGLGDYASLAQLEGKSAQFTSKASDAHCIHRRRALVLPQKVLPNLFYTGVYIPKVPTKTTTATTAA